MIEADMLFLRLTQERHMRSEVINNRFQNKSEEHLEIKTFCGDPEDNELHPTEGVGARCFIIVETHVGLAK